MNRVLDVQRPRRRRRPSDGLAPKVSVLRWPSGPATDGVFEMFSAEQAARFGSLEPESADSANHENVLLVSTSRRSAPDSPAVLLSFVNTSPSQAVRLSLKLAGRTPKAMAGTILTAPKLSGRRAVSNGRHDASTVPRPAAFRGAVLNGNMVALTVPARSVVVLTVDRQRSAPLRSRTAKRT
jgi:alpha-N-arabinofuranosidase